MWNREGCCPEGNRSLVALLDALIGAWIFLSVWIDGNWELGLNAVLFGHQRVFLPPPYRTWRCPPRERQAIVPHHH